MGKNNEGSQRIKGTDEFFFLLREKVPNRKIKDVTHARIARTIREMKKKIITEEGQQLQVITKNTKDIQVRLLLTCKRQRCSSIVCYPEKMKKL